MKGLIMKSSKRTIVALIVIGLLNGSLVWAHQLPDNEQVSTENTGEQGWGRGRVQGYGQGMGRGNRRSCDTCSSCDFGRGRGQGQGRRRGQGYDREMD